ncbi:MAG TPA: MFS transporter [Actinomycetota bacterium]|nr:MFS transporter [Actinomycetota bacterium]
MPEPPPRPSRNPLSRSNPLAPAYLCVFLFSAGEHMVHVLIPPYLDLELGATPAVVGTVLAVFAVTSLIARFPTGAIYTVDRARGMLVIGGALSAAAFALIPLVGGPLGVATLLGVDGFGWALATTSQLAVLVAARPEGISVASAMGWYAGFNGLGNFAAGVSAGVLADRLGFVPSLLILAAMPAIATAVMALAMPWGRLRRARVTAGTGRASLRGMWGHMRTLSVVAWAGAMVMVYINFVSAIASGFQPLLGLAAGLSLTEIGILASCRSWGSSTVRLGSGFIFARTDGRWLTTPLTLLSAASLFLIPSVASSFVLQVPLFLAMGVSRGLLRVTGSTEAFEAVDDERSQGMVSALLFAGLDLGKLVGPLLAGFTAEAFGLAAMFRIMPVALLAVYLPLELMAHRSLARRPRRGPERAVPGVVSAADEGPE